jgi:hypothetical protein
MEKTDKICPFLKQKCAKGTCAVFNTKFKRCDIGLLAYNLYLFAEALNDLKSTFGAVERSAQEDTKEGNETIQNLLNL